MNINMEGTTNESTLDTTTNPHPNRPDWIPDHENYNEVAPDSIGREIPTEAGPDMDEFSRRCKELDPENPATTLGTMEYHTEHEHDHEHHHDHDHEHERHERREF